MPYSIWYSNRSAPMPRSRAMAATRDDHVRVVRGDARIGVGLEQALAEGHEGVTDGVALLEGDLGRLGVGALADARAHPLGGQALDVVGGPVQVRLDHRPDVMAVGAQPTRRRSSVRVGVGRRLHVDADEDAVPRACRRPPAP